MRARTFVVAALMSASAASLAACAAGGAKSSAAPLSAAPASDGVDPTGMPPSPRAEIQRLASEIDNALVQAGLATPLPPACAQAGTCTAAPMSLPPIASDPTCKPASTQTCTQSCTLATSICDNAAKICKLTDQLGGADTYANETCERGKEACSAARTRCCGCS